MKQGVILFVIAAVFIFLTSCSQTNTGSDSTTTTIGVSFQVDDAKGVIVGDLNQQIVVGDDTVSVAPDFSTFSIVTVGPTLKCPAPDKERRLTITLDYFNVTGTDILGLEHPEDGDLDLAAEDPVGAGVTGSELGGSYPLGGIPAILATEVPTNADPYITADFVEGLFDALALGPGTPTASFPYAFNYCRSDARKDRNGVVPSGATALMDIFFFFVTEIPFELGS